MSLRGYDDWLAAPYEREDSRHVAAHHECDVCGAEWPEDLEEGDGAVRRETDEEVLWFCGRCNEELRFVKEHTLSRWDFEDVDAREGD